MKKDVKSIQGQQVVPNLPGPECIEVTKVYDWVVVTNRYQNKVQIPADCFALIQECRAEGGTVTATCTVEVPDPGCDIVDIRPADIPGVPSAQIVSLAFNALARVQFFCNGTLIPGCGLVEPISFVDEVLLCFPEGTAINCNVFSQNCRVILNAVLGDMVSIEVVLCKEVRVTAKVVLEVEAKFCSPRDVIPIEVPELECPPFPSFPEQCPAFFPPLNCLCQGAAAFDDAATIFVSPSAVTGNLELSALVCDQCGLANSQFQILFTDFPQPSPSPTPVESGIDQSFTFVANQFEQPDATACAGGILTVTGTGVYAQAGQLPENATFTLTINDAADTVSFTIFVDGLPTVFTTTPLAIPAEDIEVAPCERL